MGLRLPSSAERSNQLYAAATQRHALWRWAKDTSRWAVHAQSAQHCCPPLLGPAWPAATPQFIFPRSPPSPCPGPAPPPRARPTWSGAKLHTMRWLASDVDVLGGPSAAPFGGNQPARLLLGPALSRPRRCTPSSGTSPSRHGTGPTRANNAAAARSTAPGTVTLPTPPPLPPLPTPRPSRAACCTKSTTATRPTFKPTPTCGPSRACAAARTPLWLVPLSAVGASRTACRAPTPARGTA